MADQKTYNLTRTVCDRKETVITFTATPETADAVFTAQMREWLADDTSGKYEYVICYEQMPDGWYDEADKPILLDFETVTSLRLFDGLYAYEDEK